MTIGTVLVCGKDLYEGDEGPLCEADEDDAVEVMVDVGELFCFQF